jgi:hypothetical protein
MVHPWVRSRKRATMKHIYAVSALLALVLLPSGTYAATLSPLQSNPVAGTGLLREFVVSQAAARGINPGLATCIVSHESQWDAAKPGDDGQSMGLWQISRIWHPEVPISVSLDPESSTIWALDWIAKGHVGQWSTYRIYCLNYPVFLK